MQLGIRDRLTLLTLFPVEGNFITLKIVRELRESLSFTEEEIKQYKFVQTGNQVTWNDKQWEFKDIEIGEKASEIISEALKKLDEEKKLRDEHFTLYVKFVEGTDEKKKRNRK
ncbi:hypothetical protein LCGC14_1943690 [marine sediment metagenome]|uniref:Uncharacterized protein n=1 Tax=marine sediment metagenome TaxID=412755 RepID=A0A0F9FJI0_9ZZZZ